MALIDTGDEVELTFFNGEVETVFRGIVDRVPQATGDLWYIRYPDDTIEAFNPSCSWFVSIARLECKEKRNGRCGTWE